MILGFTNKNKKWTKPFTACEPFLYLFPTIIPSAFSGFPQHDAATLCFTTGAGIWNLTHSLIILFLCGRFFHNLILHFKKDLK